MAEKKSPDAAKRATADNGFFIRGGEKRGRRRPPACKRDQKVTRARAAVDENGADLPAHGYRPPEESQRQTRPDSAYPSKVWKNTGGIHMFGCSRPPRRG